MAVFVKAKRVTDPLDDRVKACLCGADHRKSSSLSSGSEHDGDSSSLADLIHGFLEDADDDLRPPDEAEDSDQEDSARVDPTDFLKSLLNPGAEDRFLSSLYSDVLKAVEALSDFRTNRPAFRRKVMSCLRESGYNAGICKTKWESSGGLTGGSYEFIDVVKPEASSWQRYFVDVEFLGEFEIARPTEAFSRVLGLMPRVFVGKTEEIKQIVRLVSDAAKRSLKKRGMHLPPWRKNRYMQAKWFGPYRRTVNGIPSTDIARPGIERFAAGCRSVGFPADPETHSENRRFVL